VRTRRSTPSAVVTFVPKRPVAWARPCVARVHGVHSPARRSASVRTPTLAVSSTGPSAGTLAPAFQAR
jgi:hypothetical protein